MNAVSYMLAVAAVGTGIFAFGPHHLGSSNAAYANSGVAAQVSATPAPSAEPSVAASSVPSSQSKADVDTKNFTYVPAGLTVAAGSTVTFKNSDSTEHTITADDGSFDSKNMAVGASWSHVFAKVGTYTYYCAYHRYMHGKVVVK